MNSQVKNRKKPCDRILIKDLREINIIITVEIMNIKTFNVNIFLLNLA